MIRKEITIQLDSGLDTRPVALLVQVASQFKSDIGIARVNAKSIMGMMTLGLVTGEEVTVTANGDDEQDALNQIEAYLTKKS